jgi:hypothetical protein
MTYPPQQPGPYGQQPGPYGQQPDPYGQQPGQFGGQPNPQQNPQWQQQGYGQPPMDPGFPMGPPQKKRSTGGIVAIVILVVLVLAGGGVGLYFLLNKDDPANVDTSNPQEVAQQFSEVYKNLVTKPFGAVTPDDLDPLVCNAEMPKLREQYTKQENRQKTRTNPPTPEAKDMTVAIKDLKTEGDKGTFVLAATATSSTGKQRSKDLNLTLVKDDGKWQVCGLLDL